MLIPRELTLEECLHRLSSRNVGRLAVATPLGPRIYPVNYLVDKESLVFRTNPFGTLGTFGWGFEVAFEVDDTNEAAKHGWSVLLLGRGQLLDRFEVEEFARERGLESWAGSDKSLYVRLTWRHISGREVGWNDESASADAALHLRTNTGP
jgi:uncharacterized protein